jgi:DNA (cytosine-5)-methyltransferase 1
MTTSADVAQLDQDLGLSPDALGGKQAVSVGPQIPFAEFFAGIGLVRAALEPLGFQPKWANDIEPMKQAHYVANHSAEGFLLDDVRQVHADQLPQGLELATSSFPCIDLSLAGNRNGLAGEHSGMFWEFARVMTELKKQGRMPRVILIENVTAFASSHGGKDLQSALAELTELGYSCDILTIDASHFVPQSRPRMFIVGISKEELPPDCGTGIPELSDVRPDWVRNVYLKNASMARLHYRPLPPLPTRTAGLSTIVEQIDDSDCRWWDAERLAAFVSSLSPIQSARLQELRTRKEKTWRTAYRRTRNGKATWEIRRDDIAGCLRTTGGGSSKQALVVAGRDKVQARWMTAREYARLMGARDYELNGVTPNQAQFGFGDAVVVDVVQWIGRHYLLPVLRPVTESD